MRMSLELIDTAYNGTYFSISSSKRTSQVLVSHFVKYEGTGKERKSGSFCMIKVVTFSHQRIYHGLK